MRAAAPDSRFRGNDDALFRGCCRSLRQFLSRLPAKGRAKKPGAARTTRRHSREGGNPLRAPALDSRFRGNDDVLFRGCCRSLRQFSSRLSAKECAKKPGAARTTLRHSREGGNPTAGAPRADSRLRGNDEVLFQGCCLSLRQFSSRLPAKGRAKKPGAARTTRRHSREGGNPVRAAALDSRFRGNDEVLFPGCCRSLRQFLCRLSAKGRAEKPGAARTTRRHSREGGNPVRAAACGFPLSRE